MKKNIIRQNIEILKNAQGLSESQLARDIGLKQATINKLLSGATSDPRIHTILPIADYFGVTIDQLLNPSFNPKLAVSSDNLGSSLTSIPIIPFNEIYESQDDLATIGGDAWPNWYYITDIATSVAKGTILLATTVPAGLFADIFSNRCTVIAKYDHRPKNGDFALVADNTSESVVIKKVYSEGSQSWLASTNPDIPAEKLDQNKYNILAIIIHTVVHFEEQKYG